MDYLLAPYLPAPHLRAYLPYLLYSTHSLPTLYLLYSTYPYPYPSLLYSTLHYTTLVLQSNTLPTTNYILYSTILFNTSYIYNDVRTILVGYNTKSPNISPTTTN
jgi:hypothetical protein